MSLILFLFPLINCWGVLPHKRQKRYKLWFKVVIGPNGFTGWSYNFICITFSPELAYYFLLIFCMKLEGYSCQKNYRVQFLWKIHFCPNSGILHLFVICFSRKQCIIKALLILDFPSQTPSLAKFIFWSYCPKFSWPIRLQDSFCCNVFKKIWGIKLIFYLQINIRISYK